MQTFTTHTPEETQELAERLVCTLTEERMVRGTGTIVALEGNLGAGKTVFVQGVARALGISDRVTSPTFVIEKIYPIPAPAPWKRLVHIDAYRLQGEVELHTIGWSGYATDPGNLLMVEWPEQVGMGVPERAIWITFTQANEHTREITVRGVTLE